MAFGSLANDIYKKKVSSTITKHILDTLIIQLEIIKCLVLLLQQEEDNDRLTVGESGRWNGEEKSGDVNFGCIVTFQVVISSGCNNSSTPGYRNQKEKCSLVPRTIILKNKEPLGF